MSSATNTIPEPNSSAQNSKAQFVQISKIGRMLLNSNSLKIMSGYQTTELITGVLIADHQAALICEMYADGRKNGMAERDPHSQRMRELLAHDEGLNALNNNLRYTTAKQDVNLKTIQGTFTSNIAFIQAESQILRAKTGRMLDSLDVLLEFLGYAPLDNTQPEQRLDLKTPVHALKSSLLNLNLNTFLSENESGKSLGYTEILKKLTEFEATPQSGDPEHATLASEFGNLQMGVNHLGQRLMFVAAKNFDVTGHTWVGAGTPSGGGRKRRESKRQKRQLSVALASGFLGFIGSTILSSFQSSVDHDEIQRLIDNQNQSNQNQAKLAATVADVSTLLTHVATRQKNLYSSIEKLSANTYRNLIRIQFGELMDVMNGITNLLEIELGKVIKAIESVSMNQFPSSLFKTEDLRLGVAKGLAQAETAGYKQCSEDLRILRKSKVTILNNHLKLNFIFYFPLQSTYWGSPEIVHVAKHQQIHEDGLLYQLELEHDLYAIFQQNHLIAPISNSLFQKCSFFNEQIKKKQNYENLSDDEHFWLCFKQSPLDGVQKQIFVKDRRHCVFALLSRKKSRIMKECNWKVVLLKSEKALSQGANNFATLDWKNRMRYKLCFTKNTVTGNFDHEKTALYSESAEHFHLPANCYFDSQKFVILPSYDGITRIAPKSFTVDTQFDLGAIFKELKSMKQIAYNTPTEMKMALNKYSQQKKAINMDLRQLKHLNTTLAQIQPVDYIDPISSYHATLGHMIASAISILILLTIVFFILRRRVPKLVVRVSGRAWNFAKRCCCRERNEDSEPDERQPSLSPTEPQNTREAASEAMTAEHLNLKILSRELVTLREHIHENQAQIAQLRRKIETLEKNAQQLTPQTSQSAKNLQRN